MSSRTLLLILLALCAIVVGLLAADQRGGLASLWGGRALHGPHLKVAPLEHDFGVVRQSAGPVSATFEVSNIGSEDVLVTGTPASCSCTSGSISTASIAPGETAVLTVTFDPNYHFESDERFFRTVVVESNAHEEAPKVTVWMKVDYDLGRDKLKFPPDTD